MLIITRACYCIFLYAVCMIPLSATGMVFCEETSMERTVFTATNYYASKKIVLTVDDLKTSLIFDAGYTKEGDYYITTDKGQFLVKDCSIAHNADAGIQIDLLDPAGKMVRRWRILNKRSKAKLNL